MRLPTNGRSNFGLKKEVRKKKEKFRRKIKERGQKKCQRQ
jgi:hypothetical protein